MNPLVVENGIPTSLQPLLPRAFHQPEGVSAGFVAEHKCIFAVRSIYANFGLPIRRMLHRGVRNEWTWAETHFRKRHRNYDGGR